MHTYVIQLNKGQTAIWTNDSLPIIDTHMDRQGPDSI